MTLTIVAAAVLALILVVISILLLRRAEEDPREDTRQLTLETRHSVQPTRF